MLLFFFSSRRRHTRCALVTGVQTCALPIFSTPKAKLGLPAVTLGLLPGAGGTQRLPRLVGVETALDMIASGSPISAAQAAELGLVAKLVDESHPAAETIEFTRPFDARRRQGDTAVPVDAAVFNRKQGESRK